MQFQEVRKQHAKYFTKADGNQNSYKCLRTSLHTVSTPFSLLFLSETHLGQLLKGLQAAGKLAPNAILASADDSTFVPSTFLPRSGDSSGDGDEDPLDELFRRPTSDEGTSRNPITPVRSNWQNCAVVLDLVVQSKTFTPN